MVSLSYSLNRFGDRIGLRHSSAQRAEDADRYWSASGGQEWKSNSHWRDADAFGSDQEWSQIGAEHLEMTRRLFPGLLSGQRLRILEWGVGGGANAVHFAPLAEEFVSVEISQDSLRECHRQVADVCDTPVRDVLVDLGNPEAAVALIGDEVDLFLCFYVLELVPSEEYGLRLLRIAHDVLRPGGAAVVQIKYRTAQPETRSRLRGYGRNLANMTTYGIDEFWIAAGRMGFEPQAIVLVPRNRLDERYAYYALSKS